MTSLPPSEDRSSAEEPRTSAHDRLLTALFSIYRHTLSPVFAASGLGHCRYLPTCSEYALVAVARHGWLRGSALALRRLSRCHPWAEGGLDPVPPPPSPPPGRATNGPLPHRLP